MSVGFQPRPSVMVQLDDAGRRVSVLAGRPGVGKTQLAAAYARAKLLAGWRLVAWIDAADTMSVLAGLSAVADAPRPPGDGAGPVAADVSQAVRRWLEADGERCLLVLDGGENPDVVAPVVPAAGLAKVLITSTQPSVANLGTSVKVDVFSLDEALAVLVGGTGLGAGGGAAALAAELEYLPIALAQAVPVITRLGLNYQKYLERLRAQPDGADTAPDESQPFPPSAAKAVSLSVAALRAPDLPGVPAEVMEIMAVLSAGGVRRELLHAAGRAGLLASGGRWVAADLVDQALDSLTGRSLLTPSVDGHTLSAHLLVMRVVRDGLVRQGRYTTTCRAAASALEEYAESLAGSPDRLAVRDIFQQVKELLDNVDGSPAETDPDLFRVLVRLRFVALRQLTELGDSERQAIMVGEPLIEDLERLLGPDHPDTVYARVGLAAAYRAAGRSADALPLFERTLVDRERLLGPDHPGTLAAQISLAAAYEEVDRFAEAISLYRMTLVARERLAGADHPHTLDVRASLAAAYRRAGQVATAIPLIEQNLAGRERLLGPDHPDTIQVRNQLAAAYREAGRIADAVPLIEQTLVSQERAWGGADHMSTLASRNNLAMAYLALGRPAAAIPLFEQNLAACERLLGPDHPRTRLTRQGLASACQRAGQA